MNHRDDCPRCHHLQAQVAALESELRGLRSLLFPPDELVSPPTAEHPGRSGEAASPSDGIGDSTTTGGAALDHSLLNDCHRGHTGEQRLAPQVAEGAAAAADTGMAFRRPSPRTEGT